MPTTQADTSATINAPSPGADDAHTVRSGRIPATQPVVPGDGTSDRSSDRSDPDGSLADPVRPGTQETPQATPGPGQKALGLDPAHEAGEWDIAPRDTDAGVLGTFGTPRTPDQLARLAEDESQARVEEWVCTTGHWYSRSFTNGLSAELVQDGCTQTDIDVCRSIVTGLDATGGDTVRMPSGGIAIVCGIHRGSVPRSTGNLARLGWITRRFGKRNRDANGRFRQPWTEYGPGPKLQGRLARDRATRVTPCDTGPPVTGSHHVTPRERERGGNKETTEKTSTTTNFKNSSVAGARVSPALKGGAANPAPMLTVTDLAQDEHDYAQHNDYNEYNNEERERERERARARAREHAHTRDKATSTRPANPEGKCLTCGADTDPDRKGGHWWYCRSCQFGDNKHTEPPQHNYTQDKPRKPAPEPDRQRNQTGTKQARTALGARRMPPGRSKREPRKRPKPTGPKCLDCDNPATPGFDRCNSCHWEKFKPAKYRT